MYSSQQYERFVHQVDQIRRDHVHMHGNDLHPAARETGPGRASPVPIGLRAVIEALALAASEDAARGLAHAEPETPMAS
jgi:hypothetical protein